MSEAVVVTDGEQRAALAVVRSLGAAGYRPVVCAATARSLAGASRWAAGEAVVPDPLRDPAGFTDAVAAIVARHRAALVLPVAEGSGLALLPAADRLAPAKLPGADEATFRRVCDKAEVLRVAAEVGIAVPEQRVIADPAAARDFDPGELRFPVVVKPARSVGEHEGRRAKHGVEYATDRDDLRRTVAAAAPDAFPLLLQQRVVGPGVGIFLLRWDGRTRAVFAHRRLREKPPSGGVSVYRESIAPEPGLVDLSERLLERFGWEGVAMVEYKIDAATGTPYLMEVNGRFWGSLQLAVDAGVDFPALLAGCALRGECSPAPAYRVGVRSRWWWGDVDHLLARLRRSRRELALPADAPGRLRALGEFFVLWRPGDRSEVLRLSDPKPFFRETALWLRGR